MKRQEVEEREGRTEETRRKREKRMINGWMGRERDGWELGN